MGDGPSQLEKLNILLVDDQPEGLLALEATLESLGQKLVKARSGREALRELLAQEFAVILLDVQMPGMDGYEVASLIRARPRCQDTPIIFLTASHEAEAQMTRGYAVGAVDYMFKPLEGEILRSKVTVFVELARKTELVRKQADQLRKSEQEALKLAEARAGLLAALEKRNLELQHERERAERETQFKSKFLAGMSHELRTPLNAIVGFSELLTDEPADALAPYQREYAENVLQSGRHLLSLVNDILDLSKIEAGRTDLKREWTSPELLVDEVRGVIQALADKQGVRLEIDLGGDLKDVCADRLRMKQVLYNLLSNGIKFTPRGGTVSLRGRAEESQLVLVIEDTGIGIAEADMTRLFREFERIQPTSGKQTEGTGLGLVLTKRLVEMHGGTVSARSVVGKGTAFTVTLPR